MAIPTKDFNSLIQYYKGEITDNALLNKAARLAAETHVLLKDKSVPDSVAIARVKPLAKERARLTKRLRQFGATVSSGGEGEDDNDEEGDLTSGTLDSMLKQIIKNTSKKRKREDIGETPFSQERITPGPSGVKTFKKTAPPSKIPIPSKSKLGTLLRKADKLLDKGKRQGKGQRKTEVERLRPLSGWEDWARGRKLRRQLEYDSDTD